MEQSNRNQGNTKMAVKMAACGGGIGAVFLLGGALATAVFASAFVVGRNGRSSVKDHHRCRKSPPVDDPEYKNPSNGATEELVESNSDTSALDEKPRVEEINTGDIEASEQSLRSEKLETDAISDGSVILIDKKVRFLDEKLQSEPQHEDVDYEIPEEGQNREQVRIGGGRAESEPTDEECDGEINETCRQKAVEGIAEKQPVEVDSGEVLLCCDHEEIKVVSVDDSVDEEVPDDRKEAEGGELDEEKKSENEPLLGSPGMGHENANAEVAEESANASEEGELDETKRSDNGKLELSESHCKDGALMGSPAVGRENANGEEKECEFIQEELLEDGHGNANGDEKEGRPFPTETVEIEKECEFIEEQLVEDGEKIILPMLGSLDVEHESATSDENTNGYKEKAPLPVDTAKVTLKDRELMIKGGDEGDPATNTEDHLAKEREKCGDTDELIVVKKHEEPTAETGDEKEGRPFPTETVEIEKECEFIEEQLVEDGQKIILPVLGSLDVEHESATGDEKEGRPFSTDNAEIVKECEFIEEQLVEDGEKKILDVLGNRGMDHEDIKGGEEGDPAMKSEDHLAKEREKRGDADELVVVKTHREPIEETGDDIPFDISTVSPMLREEAISVSPDSIQVAKNRENEEVVDESTEAIAGIENSPVTVTEKGENLTEDYVDETLISDRVQLTYHQEVEGKILEDKAVEKVECGDEKEVDYSGKALFGKYVTDLAALNDRLTDSTNRRMTIVTLSAVSSISCSWFFGLSFARLCLVMFLTMMLSSMVVTA